MNKYGRIERERRFLLAEFPGQETVVRTRHIVDRYIDGTTLRLREQRDPLVYKLTQKLPERGEGAQQGLITTIYLTKEEYSILQRLPAKILRKTRYSVPPFGIDVFEGVLEGLILAEAEFDSAAAAGALTLPTFVSREVSDDDRFTGGRLVCAAPSDIRAWLSEYGLQARALP